MRGKKAPSQRQLRVAEEIQHVLATLLIHNNFFITGLKASYIMLTEVDISPDLSFARIYVRAIPPVDTAEQVALLKAHKGIFRKEIGRQIRLRIVPEVDFVADTRMEQAERIEQLLNSPKVKADLESEE
jgi:ribosome-binding factor A